MVPPVMPFVIITMVRAKGGDAQRTECGEILTIYS